VRRLLNLVFVLATVTGVLAPAPGRAAGGSDGPLDMFRVTAPVPVIRGLVAAGYDVAATAGDRADLVLSPADADAVRAGGLRLDPWRNPDGLTALELARRQAAAGFSVWRSFDQPGGIRDELAALAQSHPGLVQYKVIGHSVEGREIVAVRVTRDAPAVPDGTRPAVLYASLQHAREWISGEVTRRLLRSLVDGYGTDPDTTALLGQTELWFVVVANPDGYQRTFGPDRLWRKNAADNNGDGHIDNADGVDPNRNFPGYWGYDPEGSSPEGKSQSYRGPAPASEPETRALTGLMGRVHFAFMVNYHSFGKLILYPFGWQVETSAADEPIYTALAGTPVNPAIPGYTPEAGASLYTTNGESTDWAYTTTGALAYTIELGEGIPGDGFLFPDNEALISQEYGINRPFALDAARSAADPARPRSHLGNSPPNFVVDPFPASYGDPQPVQATVARRIGAVSLNYRINGGPPASVPAIEWQGGERYGGPGDVYYRVVRGQVAGTSPGDRVEAWFEGGGERSAAFTYRSEVETGARVLVVSGGDHTRQATGALLPPIGLPLPGTDRLPVPLPALPPGVPVPGESARPPRLGPVVAALAANGVPADVYDVEAHDRAAPDPLGVLAHYAAVVWTTDEFHPGSVPGAASRLANQEVLAARDYLNDGGRLLYMGRDAGRPYAEGRRYDPRADGPCSPAPEDQAGGGCVPLSDDFFQYWLGAYTIVEGGGSGTDAGVARVEGVDSPFTGLAWAFAGPETAPGRSAASYAPVSDALGQGAYPQLAGRAAARYRRSGAPAVPNDAASVATPRTLLFGFGFEDIAGADQRAAVMGRALGYLLPPP